MGNKEKAAGRKVHSYSPNLSPFPRGTFTSETELNGAAVERSPTTIGW